jgi:hypothetical protein
MREPSTSGSVRAYSTSPGLFDENLIGLAAAEWISINSMTREFDRDNRDPILRQPSRQRAHRRAVG